MLIACSPSYCRAQPFVHRQVHHRLLTNARRRWYSPNVLLHGWDTGTGLRLIEPHSRVPVDVLDQAVEENDSVLLSVFGGVVPLAAGPGDRPGNNTSGTPLEPGRRHLGAPAGPELPVRLEILTGPHGRGPSSHAAWGTSAGWSG